MKVSVPLIQLLRRIDRALPNKVRMNLLVRRRAPLFREAKIVFIHIPKAAGSSVNQAIYGRFMGHFTVQNIADFAPNDVKSLPRFAVTRNPWSRIFSAYRFARMGKGFGGKVTAGIQNPTQYMVPEFETFERFVMEWLKEQDLNKLDGIFRPQVNFITDEQGKIDVDHLGQVENLGSTARWMSGLTGKNIEFPHNNQSGKPLDFRTFYTTEIADIIGRLYREDIETFGYDFESTFRNQDGLPALTGTWD